MVLVLNRKLPKTLLSQFSTGVQLSWFQLQVQSSSGGHPEIALFLTLKERLAEKNSLLLRDESTKQATGVRYGDWNRCMKR